MFKAARLLLVLLILVLANRVHAEPVITGKVVGVSDGDTITILENRTRHKIRLYGIDTPERGQDFGSRAGQFVSDLAFGKQVRAVQHDIDRYGRIVGTVYVENICINREVVRNGLAWVYRRYCKLPVCSEWSELEAAARARGIGLWSHPDPAPPWEFRRSRK